MKTLYLHVGTHKTGSSAIQRFLHGNRDKLQAKGYYFPIAGSYFFQDELSHGLLAHAVAEQRPEYVPSYIRFTKKECVSDIQRDIEQSSCQNLVISSEHFSLNYTMQKMLQLKEVFAPYVSVIKPIIYIRRQDLYLESRYNQRIKLGIATPSFEDFAKNDTGGNYFEYIEMLASVFGKANLIIRPYEKQQLLNGDAVQDFANVLGIKINNYQPKIYNESIPIEMVEVMRALNKSLNSFQEKSTLNKFLRNGQIHFDLTKYTVCSPVFRQELLSWYKEGNIKIANNYLGRKNGVLFEAPEMSDLPLYPGLTVDRASEIYAQIWLKQVQYYFALKKQSIIKS